MSNLVLVRLAAALGVSGAVAGCSSIQAPGIPTSPWVGTKTCASACSAHEAVLAMAEAQNFCTVLRQYYERGGQVTGGQRLFVGILGTLAGSVFSVTAAGTASKAWAGLSGATNGIQTQIDQSAVRPGGAEVIERIAKVQLDATESFKTQLDAATPDWNKLSGTAFNLPAQCSAAAGMGVAKVMGASAAAAAAAASAETAASSALKSAEAAASSAKAAEGAASTAKK